jgi:hypothetical protein
MKKLHLVGFGLLMLLACAFAVVADNKSYTPPPERGEIYVVVRYRLGGMGGMYAQPTSLSVNWGKFNKSGTIKPPLIPPDRAIGAKGFVLKLRHSKNDSIGLTVNTNGRITQGPYQGSAPSEWNDRDYAKVNW